MSVILDLADAVAAELNAAEEGTFGLDFVAARMVLPRFKLEDLSTLHVTVVPASAGAEMQTRAQMLYEVEINIGVQKLLGKDVDDEIEDLLDLVEAIGDYLRGRTLDDATYASWMRQDNDPTYAPDHLANENVFTSVLTITYRLLVAK